VTDGTAAIAEVFATAEVEGDAEDDTDMSCEVIVIGVILDVAGENALGTSKVTAVTGDAIRLTADDTTVAGKTVLPFAAVAKVAECADWVDSVKDVAIAGCAEVAGGKLFDTPDVTDIAGNCVLDGPCINDVN